MSAATPTAFHQVRPGFKPGDHARANAAKHRRRRASAPLAAADPMTSDRHYDDEERELLDAIAAYQKSTGRKFPSFCEVLAVIKGLGYAKPCPAS